MPVWLPKVEHRVDASRGAEGEGGCGRREPPGLWEENKRRES